MPYFDCSALIKEFPKKVLSQPVFFASDFLVSSSISIKIVTNSQQKMF